jgi:hypothetical protein
MTCNAPRFPEPSEGRTRLFGTYKTDAVVFAQKRMCDEFIDFDDVNNGTYFIEYDVEKIGDKEPDIASFSIYTMDRKGRRVNVVAGAAFAVAAEAYLRDNVRRWEEMAEWLDEYGDSEPVKVALEHEPEVA